jgi:hypothetical protein
MTISAGEDPISDAQDLIWALLDEQILESDFARLEEMIRTDEEIRRLYVQCVQMHVDLQQWFSKDKTSKSGGANGIPLDVPNSWDDSTLADPAF